MLISCKEKTITTVDIENQNQIIDSTLFYQQLKNYRTVGQWQYCGLAFSKKNNTLGRDIHICIALLVTTD